MNKEKKAIVEARKAVESSKAEVIKLSNQTRRGGREELFAKQKLRLERSCQLEVECDAFDIEMEFG